MANTGSCMSAMEMPCFWIATSPESPTLLYTQNTGKGHIGRLANLASRRWGRYNPIIGHEQRCCGSWEEQSCM